MVTTIVHNPTANDRVEYFGQIVDVFIDTTVEFSASHCLTDGFRGSIAHAWTEVDEGLTPSGHRQSRPKGIAEKVAPISAQALLPHKLCARNISNTPPEPLH